MHKLYFNRDSIKDDVVYIQQITLIFKFTFVQVPVPLTQS